MCGNRAVLSGPEIVAAAVRHEKFKRLSKQLEGRMGYDYGALTWLQYQLLRRQPRLHIDNFDSTPSHHGGRLNPNSYNLRLHDELRVYAVPLVPSEMLNGPHISGDADDELWEKYALNMRKQSPLTRLTIPPEGYLLKPGRLYLGRTIEYTETFNLVPNLNGRSSLGRLGMAVHITAGFGDRGYCGTWTLEITVVHPLRVYAGTAVAQVWYQTVGKGFDYRGKYNNTPGSPAGASQLWKETPKGLENG